MNYVAEHPALELALPPAASPRPCRVPIYSLRVVRESSQKAETRKIRSPRDAANIFRDFVGHADREHFVLMLLDTKNQVTGLHTVSIGDLNSSIVHPREVFKLAIAIGAASIIVCHNHPSGDTTPSPEDIAVSKRLAQAGELLGIELLDHVIIGGEHAFVSLKERGHF